MIKNIEDSKDKKSDLDKTFIGMQLIIVIAFAIIVCGLCIYVVENSFEDPIATIKNNIITLQLVMIGFSLITMLIVTIFTRKTQRLIQKFKLIVIVSILMIIAQLGIKMCMDNKYNEETFGQFYEETNPDGENKKGISIGLSGVKITEEKEVYIQNSKTSYTIFQVKTMSYIIIHALIVILILYLTVRLISKEERKAILAQNDWILNDEK